MLPRGLEQPKDLRLERRDGETAVARDAKGNLRYVMYKLVGDDEKEYVLDKSNVRMRTGLIEIELPKPGQESTEVPEQTKLPAAAPQKLGNLSLASVIASAVPEAA